MVGVEVGEDHGVEGVDAELAQAAVDQRRVGAGVDEDGTVRTAAQHDGVALADVAARRPATPRAARSTARVGTRAAARSRAAPTVGTGWAAAPDGRAHGR